MNDEWRLKVGHFDTSQLLLAGIERNKRLVMRAQLAKLDSLWMAPERLRNEPGIDEKKCDLYSFAMILFELISEQLPYENLLDCFSLGEIVNRIRNDSKMISHEGNVEYFRPAMPVLVNGDRYRWLITLMEQCWKESPEARPSFETIGQMLAKHR